MGLGLGSEAYKGDVALREIVLIIALLVNMGVVLSDICGRALECHLLADETEQSLLPGGTLFRSHKSVYHFGTSPLGIKAPFRWDEHQDEEK